MKPPSMIRDYESGDMEQCRELWRQLTEKHREIYSDPSIDGEHPEDCFNEHLVQVGPKQLWIASLDSEVVGLVGLILKEEAQREPLIVSKRHRGAGIGK